MASLRRFIGKHPLLSNMVLYAGLYGSGDLSRQTIMGLKEKDWSHAFRMACVGSVCLSPLNFTWFKVLDHVVTGTGARVVATKMACDQLLAGPVGIVIFFVGKSSPHSESLLHIILCCLCRFNIDLEFTLLWFFQLLQSLRGKKIFLKSWGTKDWKPTWYEFCPYLCLVPLHLFLWIVRLVHLFLQVGCVYWPTIQSVNFAFLPTKWRTAYVGCGAFVWCNIISFFKSQGLEPALMNTESLEAWYFLYSPKMGWVATSF